MDIDTDHPGPDVPILALDTIVDNTYTVKNALTGPKCEIQFFANQTCDSTGQGESNYYLGKFESTAIRNR